MRTSTWLLPLAIAGGTSVGLIARAEVPKPGPQAKPPRSGQLGTPETLTAIVTPKDTGDAARVALGQKLFFDGRLSADGTVACATCHDPEKGFTDQLQTSTGIGKKKGTRNSPSVLNALYNEMQFWDGRAGTLEDQAKLPIVNPIEMGMKDGAAVTAALVKIPEYDAEFKKVFGRAPTFDDFANAIAAYERTQMAFSSRFDKFIAGDEKVFTAQEKRGWAVFNGKGRCNACHAFNPTSPLFTDNKFHNIGIAAHKQNFNELAQKGIKLVNSSDAEAVDRAALETDMSELGRFLVTKQAKDVGAFKTPGLRNLLVTQPYFHDGSQATLWDAMDHYNKGGIHNPFLDGGVVPLGLSEPEIDDLVAFLATLTSDRYEPAAKKELAKQRALSRSKRPERDTAQALGKKTKLENPLGDIAPNPDVKNPAQIGGR